jgi:molecular chaperone GrpE (heat shock protein)
MDPIQPAIPPAANQNSTDPSAGQRLSDQFDAFNEASGRLHELLTEGLARSRDDLKSAFNSFAADTQKAYQRLRQELHADKRISVTLLNELLEIGLDMDHLVATRAPASDAEAVAGWGEAVEVQARKVRAALERHGIHPYDAVIGSAYDPSLHERVDSREVIGTPPGRVLEQQSPGYASRQPEFVLRRPRVIISE